MPRYRLALLLAALPLAALAACSSEELDPQGESLRAARARWAAEGVANYRLTYQEVYFGPAPRTTVVVRGGAVDSVYVHSFDSTRVEPYDPEVHRDVEGLFDFVEDALARDPDVALVSYDRALSYPDTASFDYARDVVDEENGFVVHGFERF